MKTKLSFFILIIPLLFTGCWDLVEIENRSYVINMGIDINDDGKYKVTYGMAWNNDKEKKGSVRSVEGENLSYIIENSDITLDKETYLGHTKTIILGEETVKNKNIFSEILSTLKRNREMTSKALVMECEGKAEDAVNVISEEKQMYIWNFYRTNAKNMGHIEKTTLEDVTTEIENNGITVIPYIKVNGEEIEFSGCGIISEGVLKKNFDKHESEIIYLLKGYGDGALLKGNDFTLRIIDNKRNVKVKENKCQLLLNLSAEIIYSDKEIDSEQKEKEFESEIQDFIEKEILTLPDGDYFDISKYLIKMESVNINNVRYKDFEIMPKVRLKIKSV